MRRIPRSFNNSLEQWKTSAPRSHVWVFLGLLPSPGHFSTQRVQHQERNSFNCDPSAFDSSTAVCWFSPSSPHVSLCTSAHLCVRRLKRCMLTSLWVSLKPMCWSFQMSPVQCSSAAVATRSAAEVFPPRPFFLLLSLKAKHDTLINRVQWFLLWICQWLGQKQWC